MILWYVYIIVSYTFIKVICLFIDNQSVISVYLSQSILSDILPLCEHHHIPATFFEISTIMGLLHFERMKCDAIVLEVGLGGRLDSTNIVTPHVSVITSIQMDHMGMLGNSLEEIARAKAGIMKPNVNVLVGPQCSMNIMKVCIITTIILLSLMFHTYHFCFVQPSSFSRRKRNCQNANSMNWIMYLDKKNVVINHLLMMVMMVMILTN